MKKRNGWTLWERITIGPTVRRICDDAEADRLASIEVEWRRGCPICKTKNADAEVSR